MVNKLSKSLRPGANPVIRPSTSVPFRERITSLDTGGVLQALALPPKVETQPSVRLSLNSPSGAGAALRFMGASVTLPEQDFVQFPAATWDGIPLPVPQQMAVLEVTQRPGNLVVVDVSLLVQPGGQVSARPPIGPVIASSSQPHLVFAHRCGAASSAVSWWIFSSGASWGLFEAMIRWVPE